MSEQEFNKLFSRNLLYYLELHKKSQADLAKYVGVSTAAVNQWCKGQKMPRMDKVDKICQFLLIRRSNLLEEHIESEQTVYYLSPREERLLSDFRTLNEQGQDYVLQTMDMVKDKYKKSSNFSSMENIG